MGSLTLKVKATSRWGRDLNAFNLALAYTLSVACRMVEAHAICGMSTQAGTRHA